MEIMPNIAFQLSQTLHQLAFCETCVARKCDYAMFQLALSQYMRPKRYEYKTGAM